MDKIQVIDGFLEQDELKSALEIMDKKSWKYYHASLKQFDYETPFWSTSLDDEIFFTRHVHKIIERTYAKKFKILRVYSNAQTFGQDGVFHTDDTGNNTWSFVFYLTKIRQEDVELAGGHLVFKFPEFKHKICYEPIFNRGILFPSQFIHRACSFSRYIMDMRVCIAFKLEEIIT